VSHNIIVVGRQKTGTTGVYSLIKSALAPMAQEYLFSFEPNRFDPLEQALRTSPQLSVMTKIMYKNMANFPVAAFDRRVMTVRDPRDALISTLLFKPLIKSVVSTVEMSEHERFLKALRRKERDPGSISVKRLMRLGNQVGYKKWRPGTEELLEMTDFARANEFFLVYYEDFVDDRVDTLAQYLGLPLNAQQSATPAWLSHISRSKGHGAWRDWMTPEDVEFYRPLLKEAMDAMGYEDDWELNPEPSIDPATSSRYVADAIAKRRTELAAGRQPDTGRSAATLATLHSRATDGGANDALQLAQALDQPEAGMMRWPRSALHWAREAEMQGVQAATDVRARLERELADTPPPRA